VVAFHDAIPLLFLGDDSGGNAATARLAATLLLIGASFFITDGTQAIAAGALRGLNDTHVPMWFAAVSFWLIGFTCAYGLAFPGRLGAVGIWIGFSIAIVRRAARLPVSPADVMGGRTRKGEGRIGSGSSVRRRPIWTHRRSLAIESPWWSGS
jgi:MATE family multidrug resistance protein